MSNSKLTDRLPWHDFLIRVALVVVSVLIIVLVLPRDNGVNFKIEKGKPWRYADFTAPFDFPIYKSDEAVKAERDSMLKLYEPYYDYVQEQESKSVRQFTKDYGQGIPDVPNDFVSIIANRLHRLYVQGIMDAEHYQKLSRDTNNMIRIVQGKNASSVSIVKVLSTVSAYEQLFSDPVLTTYKEQLKKCNLNDYIQANLIYDKERSEASHRDLVSSIPLATGVVQRGQKIIDRGGIVDEKAYSILQSFLKEGELRKKDDAQLSMTLLGQIMYVSLIMISFTLFLSIFRNDYFEKIRSAAMIYSLIIIFSVGASLLVSHT